MKKSGVFCSDISFHFFVIIGNEMTQKNQEDKRSFRTMTAIAVGWTKNQKQILDFKIEFDQFLPK